MKPKMPSCPTCANRAPTLVALTSRVFATWRCTKCGQEWRSDAVTGRLISRLGIKDIEGEATNAKS